MSHITRTSLAGISAVTVTALAGACARPPEMLEVTLGAQDFAFALPDTLAGGLVHVSFMNSGQEDHHAQFIRLNDGVTFEQYDATMDAILQALPTEGEVAFMRLFEIANVAGGPAPLGPGKQADVVFDLAQGQYVLVCFIPSPDGVPHMMKGMTKRLVVTAPPARQPDPPVAAGTVDMADFAFATVPAIAAGQTVLEVTNSGQEPHEMAVVRLKGISASQLHEMLSAPPPGPGSAPPTGPPPFEFVGGVQAMASGQRAWVTLDLTPGEYAMVCFVPSPANQGKPHVALGMFRAFTVN